jgi:ABC-type cobalt transport system substrate-binding protein
MSTPALTPQQEEFLSRLFALCREYRGAGVVAYSLGLKRMHDSRFSVQIDLLISENAAKSP